MLTTIGSFLLDPWEQAIDRRALLELTLVGVTAAALGCWVLFYRLPFAAESLSHALLPGLVVAALAGCPLVLGGAAGLVVAALAIAAAGRAPRVDRDVAVAVAVTGMLGIGALLALAPETPPGLSELLFGDVLGVTDGELALTVAVAALVLVALALLHRPLLAVGFDRRAARALGVSATAVDAALLLLLAATLLIGVQALGNLLVVAVLVGPAAAARELTSRMAPMMALAAVLAAVGAVVGLAVSYHLETAAGASVALTYVAIYALARLAAWRR